MKGKIIYVVPHSHIDVEWYWTYSTALEWSTDIIGSALSLLRRDPGYRFSQDQVAVIEPILKRLSAEDREFFLRMVEEGRFEIVGGMYVQPEVVEPRGETLVRQILVGKNWFLSNLGVDVEVGWFLDTFGQIAQIPQILAKSGFKYYAFMRDGPLELARSDIPADFYYELPDGSRVLTHLMPAGYGASMRGARGLLAVSTRSETRHLMFPWGGDVVIPEKDSEEMAARVAAWAWDLGISDEIAEIRTATALDYFQAIEREGADLPTLRHDFGLPYHVQDLRGCFDNRIELKKLSRVTEEAVYAAEIVNSVAYTMGKPYPKEALDGLWRQLLHEHFHDIIGGSNYDPVYEKAMEVIGSVCDKAQTLVREGTVFVAGSAGETAMAGVGQSVYVYNTLSIARTELCQLALDGPETEFALSDRAGHPVPYQLVTEPEGGKLLEFVADEVPAIGGARYSLSTSKDGQGPNRRGRGRGHGRGRSVGQNTIENRFFRIAWDPATGGLVQIYDKENQHELLASSVGQGNELIAVVEENPDMEGMMYPTEVTFRSSDYAPTTVEVEESDIRLGLVIRGPFKDCERFQKVLLYDALPRVDFRTTLQDFDGGDLLIRVSFPLQLDWEKATIDYETPYAATTRRQGHYAAQNWVDCSDGSHGVALVNTGTPGYWVADGRLDLVILRSLANYERYQTNGLRKGLSEYEDDTLMTLAREHGTHHYAYAIYSHAGHWRDTDLVSVGRSLNAPLIAIRTNEAVLQNAAEESFLSAPSEFAVVAIKVAESGEALVVRGYETTGQERAISVQLPLWAQRVATADLLENEQASLPIRQGAVSFRCAPHEIVTLILRP